MASPLVVGFLFSPRLLNHHVGNENITIRDSWGIYFSPFAASPFMEKNPIPTPPQMRIISVTKCTAVCIAACDKINLNTINIHSYMHAACLSNLLVKGSAYVCMYLQINLLLLSLFMCAKSMFVWQLTCSWHQKTKSPIHEFKVLHKSQRAF